MLIYPLIQGRELDWPWWTFASIAASFVVFFAFAALARRREREGVSPLVTPSLFRKQAFTGGLATALVFFAGMIGMIFTLTLCLQIGLHYSAVHSGASLIAWSLGTAIGAGTGAAVLAPRFGRRTLHAGLALMLAGVLSMLWVVHSAGSGLTTWDLVLPELLGGAGMGMVLAPLFDIILAGVDDDEVGSASGTLNAVQQLGGALGVAVLGTLFFSAAAAHGFLVAFERTLWVESGVLVATAALVFLLPMRAREEAPPRSQLPSAPGRALSSAAYFPMQDPMAVRVATTRRAPGSERWLPHAVIATTFVVVLPAVLVSLLVPGRQPRSAGALAAARRGAVAGCGERRRRDLEPSPRVAGPRVRRPDAVGLAAPLGRRAAAGPGREAARHRSAGRQPRGADRPQRTAGGA